MDGCMNMYVSTVCMYVCMYMYVSAVFMCIYVYICMYVCRNYLHRKCSKFCFDAADFRNNSADMRVFIEDDLTYDGLERKNLVAQIQVCYVTGL